MKNYPNERQHVIRHKFVNICIYILSYSCFLGSLLKKSFILVCWGKEKNRWSDKLREFEPYDEREADICFLFMNIGLSTFLENTIWAFECLKVKIYGDKLMNVEIASTKSMWILSKMSLVGNQRKCPPKGLVSS